MNSLSIPPQSNNSFDLDARRGIVARKVAESYAPMLLGAHSSILLPLRKVIVKILIPLPELNRVRFVFRPNI